MIKVTVHCTKHHVEAIEAALETLGALSLVINPSNDEEIFEPELNTQPMWEHCTLNAYFDDAVDVDVLNTHCSQWQQDLGTQFDITHEGEQDWANEWRQHFQSMQFGQRLTIAPSHDLPEVIDPYTLVLDPGLAFGTGKHPTTAMCLTWLDSVIQGGESVLDFGCGSGILALAASKLGAQQVRATDLDPQALSATEDNCRKNSITNVTCIHSSQLPKATYDIVIANILANPLIELKSTLIESLNATGKIALSGILHEQADKVIQAYAPECPLKIVQHCDDWVLLST